jgi:WD40 repeat protein
MRLNAKSLESQALNAIVGLLVVSASVLCSAQNTAAPSNLPELVVQMGHSSSVHSVAFSPDGKTLASGSHD